MEDFETMVHKWYTSNIKPAELDRKIQATLDYVQRFMESENNKWTIWAYEVVDGKHRKYAIRIFLDEVLHQGTKHYMKKQGAPDRNKVKEDFKVVKGLLADYFNQYTKLRGRFRVDFNKADRSLGVFYIEHL